MAEAAPGRSTVVKELTAVVTQLRRALRRSIRTDFPWEARPPAQVEVLQMLRETGPLRLGELAGRLNLAQSTVSVLVTELDRDGLVERTVDARDRRAAVIRLGRAGRAGLSGWDAAHRRRLGRALRALDADEQQRIAAALPALARLAETLNRETAGPPGARRAGKGAAFGRS
jgi:DNA-binding MarR family transcriptional regulator